MIILKFAPIFGRLNRIKRLLLQKKQAEFLFIWLN